MNPYMLLRSFKNLRTYPAGRSLGAEDILEFHAARLLLLLYICGKDGEIEGLTKLAKLDFFVRYPSFFARACEYLNKPRPLVDSSIEAEMVRHHYGPWDHRYYHILAYLEGAGLVEVSRKGANTYCFSLTKTGAATATTIFEQTSFLDLRTHMQAVKKVLAPRTGQYLKDLIYKIFQEEVAKRPLGEVIY